MSIKRIIREELEDWEWVEKASFRNLHISEDTVRQLLSGCVDLPYLPFSVRPNDVRPYFYRGKPAKYFISMCPYWWEAFKDTGSGSWFNDDVKWDNYVAILLPRKHIKVGDDIREIYENDPSSFNAITMKTTQMVKHINGDHKDEVWLPLTKDGDVIYDFVPKEIEDKVREDLKNYIIESEGFKDSSQEDWDWTKDIKLPNSLSSEYKEFQLTQWNEIKDLFDTKHIVQINVEVGDVLSGGDNRTYKDTEFTVTSVKKTWRNGTSNIIETSEPIDPRWVRNNRKPFRKEKWNVIRSTINLRKDGGPIFNIINLEVGDMIKSASGNAVYKILEIKNDTRNDWYTRYFNMQSKRYTLENVSNGKVLKKDSYDLFSSVKLIPKNGGINESESLDGWEWTEGITDDPFERYFNNGVDIIRIYPKDKEEYFSIRKWMLTLDYELGTSVPNSRLKRHLNNWSDNVYFLIYNDKFNLSFSFTIEVDEDELGPNEIIIDNPFSHLTDLNESEGFLDSSGGDWEWSESDLFSDLENVLEGSKFYVKKYKASKDLEFLKIFKTNKTWAGAPNDIFVLNMSKGESFSEIINDLKELVLDSKLPDNRKQIVKELLNVLHKS